MSGNKVFFEHINGLRGFAIILVILFHITPDVFPCCFYGVDIFLVITGYLLFLGLKKQDGGLLDSGRFAMKRAGRILPSVAVLIMMTLGAGFFLLDYQDIAEAARLGRYTLFGMANVHLNKMSSDYFAADFSDNPLMHMWYIGITLQIYLMFIVGNAVCKRISRRVWLPALFVLGAVSLSLRYCWSFSWFKIPGLSSSEMSEPSYYETFPRMWEVLAGGIVCLMPDIRSRLKGNVLTALGLLSVALPPFLARGQSASMFPVVVAGTVLIIRYMPHSSLSWVLTNRSLMFVGAISFSLYLVHLPIFVCYKSWACREMGAWDYVIMLVLAVAIAWAFYKWVESSKFSWKVWLPIWAGAMLLCVIAKSANGFKTLIESEADIRLLPAYTQWSKVEEPELYRDFDEKAMRSQKGVFVIMEAPKPKEDIQMLRIGDSSLTPSFVLVGDSHAQASFSGIDTICREGEERRAGVYLTTIISPFWNIGIPPLSRGSDYFCDRAKMEAFLYWLEKHPELKHVVVAQYWLKRMASNSYDWDMKETDCSIVGHTNSLREFCKRIKRLGKDVILIAPTPDFTINPARGARLLNRHGSREGIYKPFVCSQEKFKARHGEIVDMLKTIESEGLASLLEPASVIPPGKPHLAYENGKLYFRDKDHLSVTGAIMYMTKLKERFFELISE